MANNRPAANPGSLSDLEARVEQLEADNKLLLRLLSQPQILAANAELYKTMGGMVADMLNMIKVMQTQGLKTVMRGMDGPAPAAPEEPLEERIQKLVGIMAGGAAAAAEAMGGNADENTP